MALGRVDLPVEPAPGPGGVLLGGIVAQHMDEMDDELTDDFLRLTIQLQEGRRIPQPRLRHRFQVDRVGLTASRHRLLRASDGKLTFDFETKGSGPQQILGAVYAAGRLAPSARRLVMDAIRKGVRWTGPVDEGLVAYLSGLDRGRQWSSDAYADPVAWALDVLDLTAEKNGSVHLPDRSAIVRQFRRLLRTAHPDHGGDEDDAAQRIADLTEARRILTG